MRFQEMFRSETVRGHQSHFDHLHHLQRQPIKSSSNNNLCKLQNLGACIESKSRRKSAAMAQGDITGADSSTEEVVRPNTYSYIVNAKIQDLKTPHFEKTMHNKMVFAPGISHRLRGGYLMELPAKFVREHGDKLLSTATLRGPTGQEFRVLLKIVVSDIQARVSFSTGWRSFASAYELDKGDLLIFSLVAMSTFVVYIYSHAGTLLKRNPRNGLNPRVRKPSLGSITYREDRTSPTKEVTLSSEQGFTKDKKRKVGVISHSDKKKGSPSSIQQKGDSSAARRRLGASGLYSQSELFAKFEEVVRGKGDVTRFVDGKLVKWEPVEIKELDCLFHPGDPEGLC